MKPTAHAGRERHRPPVAPKDLLWWVYLYPMRSLARALPPRWFRAGARALIPPVRWIARRPRRLVAERMGGARDAQGVDFDVEGAADRYISNAAVRATDDLIVNRLIERGELGTGRIEGIEHLEAARARGRGVLVVSGHFYANRVAKRRLMEDGISIMSIRHGLPPDRAIGKLGRRLLQPQYVQFLHEVIRDEIDVQQRDCGVRILQRLRENGLVNVHLDAAFSRKTMHVDFLWGRRRIPTGFLDIARATGAALVPMLCLGSSRGFEVRFEPAWSLREADTEEAFARENLEPMVRRLEEWILAYPDQWDLWIRW